MLRFTDVLYNKNKKKTTNKNIQAMLYIAQKIVKIFAMC